MAVTVQAHVSELEKAFALLFLFALALLATIRLFRELQRKQYPRRNRIIKEIDLVAFQILEKKSATTALILKYGPGTDTTLHVEFKPEGVLDELQVQRPYVMSVYRNQPLWIAPAGCTERPSIEDDVERVIAENRDAV